MPLHTLLTLLTYFLNLKGYPYENVLSKLEYFQNTLIGSF